MLFLAPPGVYCVKHNNVFKKKSEKAPAGSATSCVLAQEKMRILNGHICNGDNQPELL